MKRYDIDCSSLGVPRQYSLYYAMGLALAMEGVMSACYHVCPTTITFQFDTTFMYLIAILMFMKLYQVRNSISRSLFKLFISDPACGCFCRCHGCLPGTWYHTGVANY